MKRIIALIFLLSLMLTGCAVHGDLHYVPPETTDENLTEPPAPEDIDLSGYTVVRSSEASPLVVAITAKLFSDIQALGGSSLGISDDFLKDTDPASDEVKSRFELLVGETNRPESLLENELGLGEVIIKQIGNKIVVRAGDEVSLESLCEQFVQKLTVEDGKTYLTLPEGNVFSDILDCTDSMGGYLVADQKNSKITFYSINRADLSTASLKMSFSLEQYNAAGFKLRHYGDRKVLLIAYGSTRAKMLDIETGKTLWYTENTGSNPHSIELTPNGVIAVASSTGAVVNFYNATDAEKMLSVPFPDAHGVLYDPDTELVFAIGENKLRAFSVRLDTSGMPVAVEDKAQAFALPSGGAHDLQPVSGNTDRFWITTTSAVYQYSVSSKRIVNDYDGAFAVNTKNVKGIGNFDDGSIMYVTPDGKFKDWTSESVYYVHRFNGKYYKYTIKNSDTGTYKLRVYNLNYQ